MRRAIAVLAPGAWSPAAAVARATLTFEQRYRRRLALTDDAGRPFLLDLPRAQLIADQAGLALAGGGVILVCAAREPVLEAAGRDARHTARLAWHLGNRHAAVEVLDDGRLRLADDAVLAAMLAGLGATVVHTQAPFSPEAGAYEHASPSPPSGDAWHTFAR